MSSVLEGGAEMGAEVSVADSETNRSTTRADQGLRLDERMLGPAVRPIPGVESFRRRLTDRPWSRRAKRAVDLAGAAGLLLITIPLFLIVALAIATTSRGPIFFRQWRVGRDGERFRIWKFRSMYRDAEERLERDRALNATHRANGFKFPPGEDPRVTRVGYWLRRTSLDELPQLLNVILGQMSLVGPRPVVVDELKDYEYNVRAYLAVRPGITGAWQIKGRSTIGFPERGEIDADYVRDWTLWGDMKILVRTIPAVLRKTGAH